MGVVVTIDAANQRAFRIDRAGLARFVEMPAHAVATVEETRFLRKADMPAACPAAGAGKGAARGDGIVHGHRQAASAAISSVRFSVDSTRAPFSSRIGVSIIALTSWANFTERNTTSRSSSEYLA